MGYIKAIELKDFDDQIECLESIFSSLVDSLEEAKLEELKEAVYMREDTVSTYLEDNLAVPHGRVEGLDDDYIIVGINRGAGIDWPSSDKKAKAIVLIGIDKSKISRYLFILQKLIKWYKANNSDLTQLSLVEIENELNGLI
ncbi:MAG: PTS sugar transporter subunit IIA [Opitutales bacterium]